MEASSIDRLIDAPLGSGRDVLGDEAQNQTMYSKIKLLNAIGDGGTRDAIAKIVNSNLRYWKKAVEILNDSPVIRRKYGTSSAGIEALAKDLQVAAEQETAMQQIRSAVGGADKLYGLAKDGNDLVAFKKAAAEAAVAEAADA